jgi:hypothetical protein
MHTSMKTENTTNMSWHANLNPRPQDVTETGESRADGGSHGAPGASEDGPEGREFGR